MAIIALKVGFIVAAFGFWCLFYGLECWINGGAACGKNYLLAMQIEGLKQDWRWLWNRPGPGYPGPIHFLCWHVGCLVVPIVSAFCW